MGLIRAVTARYLDRREEAGDVTAFRFQPQKPITFTAGQHGVFFLGRAGRRPFTIASAPEDDELVVATKLGSGSRFKTALAAMRPGDPIKVRGPMARFTLAGSTDEVVLIAQGIGITPFRSFLRHLDHQGTGKHTTLIQVGRGHAFRDETEALAGEAYYPTDAEQFRLEVKRAVTERPEATCYLSGAPAFVEQSADLLTGLGVPRRQQRRASLRGY